MRVFLGCVFAPEVGLNEQRTFEKVKEWVDEWFATNEKQFD